MKGWHAAERPEHGGLPHFRTLFLIALILISSSFAVSCSPLLWPEDDSIGKTYLDVTIHNGYEQHNSQAALSVVPIKIITSTGSVGDNNALVILDQDTLLHDIVGPGLYHGFLWYSDTWITSRVKHDLAVQCENGTIIYSPIFGFDPPEFTLQSDDSVLVFPGDQDTLHMRLPVELKVTDFNGFQRLSMVLWREGEYKHVLSVDDSTLHQLEGPDVAECDSLSFSAVRTKNDLPTTRSDAYDGLATRVTFFYNNGYPVRFDLSED